MLVIGKYTILWGVEEYWHVYGGKGNVKKFMHFSDAKGWVETQLKKEKEEQALAVR